MPPAASLVSPHQIKKTLLTSAPACPTRGLVTSLLVCKRVADRSRAEKTYRSLRARSCTVEDLRKGTIRWRVTMQDYIGNGDGDRASLSGDTGGPWGSSRRRRPSSESFHGPTNVTGLPHYYILVTPNRICVHQSDLRLNKPLFGVFPVTLHSCHVSCAPIYSYKYPRFVQRVALLFTHYP